MVYCRKTIDAYSKGVKSVGEKILRSVSTIMGMDEEAFLGLYNDLQALRVNYYPACCRPDDVLGISPHSDRSTITILMQEEDIKGLQIKHNGFWVPVKPVTDALVVNVGDVIEVFFFLRPNLNEIVMQKPFQKTYLILN